MHQVIVTFDVANREQAVELEGDIVASLGERSLSRAGQGSSAPAPWIPGAALKNVTEWSVDIDAED